MNELLYRMDQVRNLYENYITLVKGDAKETSPKKNIQVEVEPKTGR